MRELETIHNQVLRLVLGAFPTSPVESLYSEANECSLSLRREKLAKQYYTKLYSCTTNSAHECVFSPNYKGLYERKETAIKPFGLRMENSFQECAIDKNTIHESFVSEHPPWMLKQPNVILDLTKHTKSNTNSAVFIEAFNNILEQYPDHQYIFTDGSKDDEKVGCAAIIKEDIRL